MRNSFLTPRLRIVVEREDSDDGMEYILQTDNRDAIAWDMVRHRKNWPAGNEAQFLYLTTLAWNVLKRSGETSEKLEQFIDHCLAVEPVDADGNFAPIEPGSVHGVNPTTPGVDTD